MPETTAIISKCRVNFSKNILWYVYIQKCVLWDFMQHSRACFLILLNVRFVCPICGHMFSIPQPTFCWCCNCATTRPLKLERKNSHFWCLALSCLAFIKSLFTPYSTVIYDKKIFMSICFSNGVHISFTVSSFFFWRVRVIV